MPSIRRSPSPPEHRLPDGCVRVTEAAAPVLPAGLASERTTALLIVNPRAGLVARSRAVRRVAVTLEQLGWDVEVRETAARGEAADVAREAAARGVHAVFTAGGDGTLNEAIQGLAGTETAIGALPLGTMNVWARELGLVLDPVEAARQLASGQVRRVDLGRANGRYFLLMAGLGVDAEAVLAAEGAPKRRFGALALIVAGIVAGARTTGSRLTLRVDGQPRRLQGAMVVVGNTRLWAGAVQITRRATASDGVLDVCIFPGRTLWDKLRHLALVLVGRHEADPDVTFLRARELLIVARPPLPLQVDGEPLGTTPARIEVVPGALRVLAGPGTAAALAGAPIEPIRP